MMIKYNKDNLSVGNWVLSTEDPNDNWGQINGLYEDYCDVQYPDGLYEVEYDGIRDCRSNLPLSASARDDGGVVPVVSTDNKPLMNTDDDVVKAALISQESLTVRPGVIVLCPEASAYNRPRLDPNRLWVVLAWTKNSNRAKVNVTPVNGDPNYSGAYTTLSVDKCKPVKFKSLIKGGK